MTEAHLYRDRTGRRRRAGGVLGAIPMVGVCLVLCAGCGKPKEPSEGVPGRGPDEIAAASSAAGHYRRGIELYDAGRYRKAVRSFRAAVRDNPEDPRPYLEIGACYSRLGDAGRELAAYDEALAVSPEFVPAHNSRGVALLRLDRAKEAVAAFERALKLEVKYTPGHINIAIAYSKLGEYELALMSLVNAEQFGAPTFDVESNRGLVLVELERYPEAAAAFERALQERPAYAPVRFERAMALAKADRPEEAILELERVTTLQRAFTRAYLEKARLLAQIGQARPSLLQYGEYLSLVPKDAQAWNEIGNLRFARGEYEHAEACFRKAVKYRHDFYKAYLNLAATLERLDRGREAARVRRRAERYKPEGAAPEGEAEAGGGAAE